MGLDVVVYKKDGSKSFLEIEELTHKEIFLCGGGLNIVSRLEDYYLTNIYLDSVDSALLAGEMSNLLKKLSLNAQENIRKLIDVLGCGEVVKIHIAGD